MSMQNSVFYISKDLIAKINGEEVLQQYENVSLLLEYQSVIINANEMKIIDLSLEVRSHRLILFSKAQHAFLINGEIISDVSVTESGILWGKEYFIKLHTQYGKIKIQLKNYNQAKVTIQAMVHRKKWLQKHTEQNKSENQMFSGMFNKIEKEKEKINIQSNKVSQSFGSFDILFGNLREIKKIMADMKGQSGQADGDNPEVKKILKDMGFVAVVSKEQSGNDYYRQLAKDLYGICQSTLFKNYGGMVSLLDLFYFYNKKRQLSLISPEELLSACKLFQQLGLNAKLMVYANNVVIIESTSFDPEKDFQENFNKFFINYKEGLTAEEIARRKGLPVAIVEIKLKRAVRNGKLAVSDRIEGVKYYKNLLLTV